VIEKSRAKIVVQNYLVAGFAAATSLRAKGVRSIAVLHSDDPLYRSLVESQRNGDLAVEFDHAVAVSCFLKELVRERLGEDFPASRIPYGISRNVGTASPPAEQFRLVYVGRLVQEQKRICDVVTALCRAVREIPGVTADIIGDGSDRKTAEEVLISNGSPPQVRFLGAITPAEVRRRLPHYHAKVLLSDYEGLPVSLLEAMSAGVVPVCTAMRSGINELVMHDQSGIIVEDRQNGFISAVRQLRQNQPLWTSLSSRAREMARAFDAETCADQWTAVINKVEQMKVFKARTIKFGRQHFPRWRQEFDWDMQRKPSTIENVASTWRIRFGRYRSKILHNYSR
jgi:glycosyltransferase involved in cell wall biosynthesis